MKKLGYLGDTFSVTAIAESDDFYWHYNKNAVTKDGVLEIKKSTVAHQVDKNGQDHVGRHLKVECRQPGDGEIVFAAIQGDDWIGFEDFSDEGFDSKNNKLHKVSIKCVGYTDEL